MYIENSNSSTPLIYGNFNTDLVGINGKLGVGTMSPSETFHVVGTARFQSLTQDNLLTRVMVTDVNGKVYWRDAATLAVGDNLGNHIATQSITASANNSYDIGTAANNFRNIYFGGRLYVGSYSYWRTTSVGTAFASIFIGQNAGISNTSGTGNTALGMDALTDNTIGIFNTAIGGDALEDNINGHTNVAVGNQSLQLNTTGIGNVAVGVLALQANDGDGNIGVGLSALAGNTSGNANVAIGAGAMQTATTGSDNTAIGDYAAATAGSFTNSTAIGHNSTFTASNQVRIGDANVTSIGGQVSWSTLSDGRFKKSLKQDVAGLDFIRELKPVSYVVDNNAVDNFLGIPQENRPKQRSAAERQTGFVAQDVEAVVKKSNYAFYGVESPKSDKDHYSIRYSEFVVPLVKAVQELDAKVASQQTLIEEQRKLIDKQQEMLVALMDRMATVSAEPAAAGTVLYQNHPNPFSNGETEITMDIPESVQSATVTVYDMNGKTIDRVPVTARGKSVSVKAGGGKMTSGIYLYSLTVDGRLIGVNKMAAE